MLLNNEPEVYWLFKFGNIEGALLLSVELFPKMLGVLEIEPNIEWALLF